MADNVTSGGIPVATDELTDGFHAQLNKIIQGNLNDRTFVDKPANTIPVSTDTGHDIWTLRKDTPVASYAVGRRQPLASDDKNRLWVNVDKFLGHETVVVKHAVIEFSTLGPHTLVSLVSGKKIKVTGYSVVTSQACGITFRSDTTAITGKMEFGITGGIPRNGTIDSPVMETSASQALVIDMDTSVQVGGHVSYIEEV